MGPLLVPSLPRAHGRRHTAVHINVPVKRLCLVAPSPTILSSLDCTDMRPYEKTCIDYLLSAESLYVRVELQCFLYFEIVPRGRPLIRTEVVRGFS